VISTEKPGSPTELVHFGTKGMKWGVHRTKGTRKFGRANPTIAERSIAIDKARESASKTQAAYKKEKRGSAARAEKKAIHLKNPDLPTALRLKAGEKVVLAILGSQGYLPPVALGVQVGVAARVGKRRALEA